MARKAAERTKAQELQRVRENQQRSRDRKRAHVVELEEKVRRLSERLQRSEGGESGSKAQPSRAATENDARRELLRALGIDDAAQEQFVRAFSRRTVATETASGLKSPVSDRASEWKSTSSSSDAKAALAGCPTTTPDANDGVVEVPSNRGNSCCGATNADELLRDTNSPSRATTGVDNVSEGAGFEERLNDESQLVSAGSKALQSPGMSSQSTQEISPVHQALFTPCLWNASMQADGSCPEGMTGCSIAFSMLLANNSRGYTFADLDARLQAAYRQDASVAEGCSVLNKVLFQLLSDIS